MIGIRVKIIPKFVVSLRQITSSPTDGSVDRRSSRALMRDVLDAHLSPLTNGQNTPLVDQDVLFNVSLLKALCTSQLFAMPLAS